MHGIRRKEIARSAFWASTKEIERRLYVPPLTEIVLPSEVPEVSPRSGAEDDSSQRRLAPLSVVAFVPLDTVECVKH
jgi:hypothetical protein